MAPKWFYDSRCMWGRSDQNYPLFWCFTVLSKYSKFDTITHILFENRPSHGVEGTPAGTTPLSEIACSWSLLELGCPATLKIRVPPTWLTWEGHADLRSLRPSTHSILRVAEAHEELAWDHKPFPLFWDKPRSLCFLLVLTSLGNCRC